MLVALASLGGSPGVTTLAVALGLQWPCSRRAVVVEADPAGGDLATWFGLPSRPWLRDLAVAAYLDADPSLVDRHSQWLLGGRVAVIPGPARAEEARIAVDALAHCGFDAIEHPDLAVIVDCGRWAPDSPATPLLREADAVLLVVRPQPSDLTQLVARMPQVGRWRGIPGLVLAGGGCYPSSQLAAGLEVPVMAVLPVDRRSARVLRADAPWRCQTADRPLLSTAGMIARAVSAVLPQYMLVDGHARPDQIPAEELIIVTDSPRDVANGHRMASEARPDAG